MLAGLRGTASLTLRSSSQILYSRAFCATRFRFCCLAPTLKSHYSTRKPDVKDTNRRSKQLDLDLSALRESKKPEQKRGNSSQPRLQRDQYLDGNAQDSARRRDDDKPQNSARERHKAMLEFRYARRQNLVSMTELKAFWAGRLGWTDGTVTLEMARELIILLDTSQRLKLVYLKKLSTFAVAVIFAPVGAEGVTTVDRLRLGLGLTFSTVLFMCSQAFKSTALGFVKLHVKALEWEQERNR